MSFPNGGNAWLAELSSAGIGFVRKTVGWFGVNVYLYTCSQYTHRHCLNN